MIIQKIERFEKHAEDSYSVWYENLGGGQCCMSEAKYNLAKCIDEFLRRAIDPKDIERIVDLTSMLVIKETLEQVNDYPMCDG